MWSSSSLSKQNQARVISIVSYELEMITSRTVANTEGIGRGNVGAISLNNFCIAIDSTMYVSTGDVFRTKLEEHFKVPVKFLIITHYHSDHTFGMKSFNDIVSISNIHVSENLQNPEISERYKGYVQELEKDDPLGKGIEFLLPTLLFTESVIINDENLSVEVNHVGGHTSGSSFIFFPEEKVLFAGDLIFEDKFPYAGDVTCDPEKWITAMKRMKALNPDFIIPGHGPVMKGSDKLDRHEKFFIDLRSIIKDAITDGLKPEEIEVPTTFDNVDPELKSLTVNHWLKYYKTQI